MGGAGRGPPARARRRWPGGRRAPWRGGRPPRPSRPRRSPPCGWGGSGPPAVRVAWLSAARRLGVVVAERRLPGVAVLEADHPPARLVGVAAVGGQREHPHERGGAHLLGERRLVLRAH